MKQRLTTPWNDDIDNTQILDLDYFANHSGNKNISCLVENLLVDNVLTEENIEKLIDLIYTRYNVNWSHLYNILKLEYDPIENYSMTESGLDKNNYTDANTYSHGLKISTTANSEDNDNRDIYGFNNSSGTPADKTKSTSSGNSTESHSGDDIENKNGNNTLEHTLTRSGNIGVTTSQQMIESEIDLWKWQFFEQVYKDIDKILTINIY